MKPINFLKFSFIAIFAQQSDPLKFFQYESCNMSMYFYHENGFDSDIVKNLTIHDSVDSDENIYFTQVANRINPVDYPLNFLGTSNYIIDTSLVVHEPFFQFVPRIEKFPIYKQDIQLNHKSVVHPYQDSNDLNVYKMAKVVEVISKIIFGKSTIIKAFVNHLLNDSSATSGLAIYCDEIACNFGLYSHGGCKILGVNFLKGSIIDSVVYENTAKILTLVKELSNNIVTEFKLYPNLLYPFNQSSKIKFTTSNAENISLIVYDIMRQEIKRLIYNKQLYPGSYKYTWDGKNESGQLVLIWIFYSLILNGSVNITYFMILKKYYLKREEL